jgi:ADP-ribose pyrophosphatase YjhB (NUDIX family)
MQSSQPTRIEVIARGIMFHGERVLLCQNRKHGYFYLPGGHVESGETAAAALAREMQEEAAIGVAVGRVVLVEEHLFVQGGKSRHEINVYFSMSTTADPTGIRSVEDQIAFAWVAVTDLEHTDIRPAHSRDVVCAAASGSVLPWRSVQAH